jgi:hypothetical protein
LSNDRVNLDELAWRSGVSRRLARNAAWHAAYRAGPVTEDNAKKIEARARFAKRLQKRHAANMLELADILRPRVSVDMPAPREESE